ncbi:MAG TPA: hypothetical protein VF924_01685 [Stellaceae bacterium]
MEQRDDAVDRKPHFCRRRPFCGGRKPLQHALARLHIAPFGELHAEQALVTPGDAAPADRRVEKRESVCRHAAIVAFGHGRHTPLISHFESALNCGLHLRFSFAGVTEAAPALS